MSSPFSVKAQLADDIRRVRIPTDVLGAASSLGATFATDAALIQMYWTGEYPTQHPKQHLPPSTIVSVSFLDVAVSIL